MTAARDRRPGIAFAAIVLAVGVARNPLQAFLQPVPIIPRHSADDLDYLLPYEERHPL